MTDRDFKLVASNNLRERSMKDKQNDITAERYFLHCYGHLSESSDHIFNRADMLDFAEGWTRKQNARIAELEKEIADWFLVVSERDERIDSLQNQLQTYREYCERNGMGGI